MVVAMKITKNVVMAIPVLFFLISFVGTVYADIPVHAVPGQLGLSTTTSMDVLGITTTSTAVSLQQGSHTLNDPPLENGGFPWEWWAGEDAPLITGYSVAPFVIKIYKGKPIPQGEVQYAAGYNEDLTSVSGSVIYQKTMSINTANKSAGVENIAADRLVTFIGGDGGRMTTSENILIDGAGAQTIGANQVLCPFTSAANPFFPPFCNIVVSGSSADISTGSISTSAGVRFIAASADVPVAETYHINVKGVMGSGGDADANGTVSAFIKANLQEGTEQQVPRWFTTDPIGFIPVKSDDLSYSEISTASGSIHGFTKDIQYQSSIRLV
jgi:hypothetical protein